MLKASSFIWLLPGLLLSLSVLAKPVRYQVEGVKGATKENVVNFLDTLPPIEADRIQARFGKIRDTVTRSLQALGYYAADIDLVPDEGDASRLTVRIQPGEPVRIRQMVVRLQGEAQEDKSFAQLMETLDLKPGEVLHHGKYETIKDRLKSRALARGYFDAQLLTSTVKVYPRESAADVEIVFDSGARYHYGSITVTGLPQDSTLIDPLITFKKGQPYRALDLAELSQSLSETGYFQQIDVHPELAQAADNRMPVSIVLKPRSRNLVEVGLGVSTDEGPRMQVNWGKPWLNRKGHSLTTQFKVSAPRQEFNVAYRIPGRHPLQDYYSLQTGLVSTHQNDTDSNKLSVGAHYWTKLRGNWERDYFVRAEYENYTQGLDSGSSLLLLPGVTITRLRVEPGLDPGWGDRQILTTEFSDQWWGSDTNFVRVWGRSKWLRSINQKHRFIWRAEQGGVWVDDLEDVPPSLRFFNGGDQTVRGFSFESIAPFDSAGNLTGGRYMTALSAEYAYQLSEKWRVATFMDTGTATHSYSDPWKIGTGLGLRRMTPIGQVRIDLAFGVSETHVPFRLHFGLGPEL